LRLPVIAQCTHGTEALGLAGRVVEGRSEAAAILDFLWTGSMHHARQLMEGIADGPGRGPILAVSLLAFTGTGPIDESQGAFGKRFGKSSPDPFPDRPHKPEGLAMARQRNSVSRIETCIRPYVAFQVLPIYLTDEWWPNPVSAAFDPPNSASS
jgi:hypothetical protein